MFLGQHVLLSTQMRTQWTAPSLAHCGRHRRASVVSAAPSDIPFFPDRRVSSETRQYSRFLPAQAWRTAQVVPPPPHRPRPQIVEPVALPSLLDCRHFINLTNGIEALPRLHSVGLPYSFVRIQSTACEQQLFEKLIGELDSALLLHLALGQWCAAAGWQGGSRQKGGGGGRSSGRGGSRQGAGGIPAAACRLPSARAARAEHWQTCHLTRPPTRPPTCSQLPGVRLWQPEQEARRAPGDLVRPGAGAVRAGARVAGGSEPAGRGAAPQPLPEGHPHLGHV